MSGRTGIHTGLDSRAIVGRFFQRLELDLAGIWANQVGWLNPDATQETETYKWNREYEATLPFKKADVRRDKTGQIMMRIDDLARRTADHWNKLVTELITTNGNDYSGGPFFAAAHAALGQDGGVKNDFVAADIPDLNVALPTSPTQTEMSKIIIGLVQSMYGILDDRAEPMNGDAKEWCVMVPSNMMGALNSAVRVERLDNGQSNSLLAQGFNILPKVNPRLDASSQTQIFIFRTDTVAKPFILQSEVDVEVKVLAGGSEHEILTGENLFGVEATRAAGYGIFQYAARGTLS